MKFVDLAEKIEMESTDNGRNLMIPIDAQFSY